MLVLHYQMFVYQQLILHYQMFVYQQLFLTFCVPSVIAKF
jgi:hypothetical protein